MKPIIRSILIMLYTLTTIIFCLILSLNSSGKVYEGHDLWYGKGIIKGAAETIEIAKVYPTSSVVNDLKRYVIVDNKVQKIKRLELSGVHKEGIISSQQTLLLRQQKLLLFTTAIILFLSVAISILIIHFHKRKNLQKMIWERKDKEMKAESIEIQLKQLTEERSRIAQEMHDDLGTTLSSTLMGIELLNMKQNDTEALTIINASTYKLTEQINEIIWNLNIENDNLASLSDYLYRFSKDFLKLANIELIWDQENIEANKTPVQGFLRRSVYLCFKELINNVVKHAGATEVIVRINYANEHLFLLVKDNGCGIEKNRIRGGNGIANLGKSIMKINGNIYWVNSNGTEVHISIKL